MVVFSLGGASTSRTVRHVTSFCDSSEVLSSLFAYFYQNDITSMCSSLIDGLPSGNWPKWGRQRRDIGRKYEESQEAAKEEEGRGRTF